MKAKNLLSLLAAFVLFALVACQKEGSNGNPDTEIETTFKLSENQAVSEAIGDDVDAVFLETSYSEGLMFRGTQANRITSCATVNVTGSGFPKTVTIDFGTGCTSPDGITRKGKIIVVISDTVSQTGATAQMTFDGYHVQGFKVEGSITWTNTTTPNGFSWTREINDGKVTAPGGNYYWLHEGMKYVTQVAGSGTPLNLLDDVYSITGEHTVTNPDGKVRTATVTEALEKKVICHNVSKGKIKIQGPNHFAIVDFGDGTCDRVATISIDGNPPRTFLLP